MAAGIAVAVAAGLVCAATARGGPGRAWALLGASALLWAVGTSLSLPAEGGLARSTGAALILAAAVTAGLGITRLPGAPPHASGRGRTAVDGLIVAGSALFLAWWLGMDSLYAGAEHPLVLAAAVANLAVAAAAVVIVTRARPAARRALARVAIALSAVAAGGCAMAYLELRGPAQGLALLYAGWGIGWAGLALAARSAREEPSEVELEPGLPTRASVFVPSVPFAVGIVAAAAAAAGGELHGFLVWNAGSVLVLIVMRQVLALWENISFWRTLEAKIEARTDELRRSERRFRSLVQNSSDVIAVLAQDGELRYLSPAAETLFGYRAADIQGPALRRLVVADDLPRVLAAGRELIAKAGATESIECRVVRADGQARDVEAMVTNLLHDPAVEGLVVNARDISERKALERQLTHRAFHDPLTELANRALFGNRLEHALRSRRRAPNSLAVLFLDLDDFKNVNDSLGHEAGDQMLEAVARRLLEHTRPSDTVARLGGDEFGILLEEIDGALGAARIATRVLGGFEEPLGVGNRALFVRASIGIATNSSPDDTAELLLRNADVAMYTAKARGKGRFEHFEHRMHAALVDRLALEHDLHSAVENEEFELHYQPVLSLESGGVSAVEALIRWQHPERGRIQPLEFIQLAEQTGLIVPIGRWVLNAACRQAVEWRDRLQRRRPPTMMVNVSAKQLQDRHLVDDVAAALAGSGLEPGDLLLEVTESELLDDDAALDTMQRIRGLGVRLGIDDFGTKYSSLSYLRRLPVDVVKIDREFIRGVDRGSPEGAVVDAIVGICRAMRLTPIAEGVEEPAQEQELRRMGCPLAQGYLFARPAPATVVLELIADADASPRLSSAPLPQSRH
jgi:diguanylate cyclase (GGDEF)-like protein/PAS domain S-box-containing protein